MKQTVGFCDFVDAFRAFNRYDQFGYDGLRVLFDYLESLEEDLDEDLELDVIALCCDYAHATVDDIAQDYSICPDDAECWYAKRDIMDDEEKREAVRLYLEENTVLCGETDSGFVYCTSF